MPLVGATVVTKQAWDQIPQATRDLLMPAAAEAGRKIQEAGRQENDNAVQEMKKLGVEVHAVPPPVEQEWRRLAEAAHSKIRGSLVPADIFDRAKQLVEGYRASHQGATR